MLLALHFTLWGAKNEWASLDASMAELWAHPPVLAELRELLDVLEEQSGHLTYPVGPVSEESRFLTVPIN